MGKLKDSCLGNVLSNRTVNQRFTKSRKTLRNGLMPKARRGDLGAALAACWGTAYSRREGIPACVLKTCPWAVLAAFPCKLGTHVIAFFLLPWREGGQEFLVIALGPSGSSHSRSISLPCKHVKCFESVLESSPWLWMQFTHTVSARGETL